MKKKKKKKIDKINLPQIRQLKVSMITIDSSYYGTHGD